MKQAEIHFFGFQPVCNSRHDFDEYDYHLKVTTRNSLWVPMRNFAPQIPNPELT